MDEAVLDLLGAAVSRFINFFPYMLLIVLTFRRSFRMSGWKVGICLTVLAALDILIRLPFYLGYADSRIVMLLVTALYAGCFFLCVRTEVGKALFVLLMVLNYANMATSLAIYLLFLSGREGQTLLSFPNVLALAAVQLVTFPLMFLYIRKRIQPLVDSDDAPKVWRVVWLVPAAFYIIYYFSYYYMDAKGYLLRFYSRLHNMLFILLLQGCFFLVYEIIRLLLRESSARLRLVEENRYLSMMAEQYDSLLERIEATSRARHDLRHHLAVLDGFLQQRDWEGMNRYLSQYRASLPDGEGFRLCANPAVNMVACYYRDLARQERIPCSFSLELPQTLPLPENDFCGILGNLLENAWEASCRMEGGEPFLQARAWTEGPRIFVLVVENRFQGDLSPKENGFLSSKRKGMGVGLDSVRAAAERHNGLLKVEHENGIFRACVFLNPSVDGGHNR